MQRVLITFLLAAVFCVFSPGCNYIQKDKNEIPDKLQMIKTDEAFSNMSRQQGMRKAFLEYIDEEGILLRPNHMPVIGADAIEFLSQDNDTSYTLTWKPSAGEIAASGDLGFTYGVYTLTMPDTTLSGTYVSIWKKQADGKWKYILGSGNQGIESSPPVE